MHNLDSNELTEILINKMRQPYVESYIQKPFIDHEKITFLNEIYDRLELPVQEKKQLITTIMLVQIALDTHERIPSRSLATMSKTEKQLSVLAGDYYSGLYYLLLSEMDQIDMIQLLADAIKQINEKKMSLFYGEMNTFHDLLQLIQQLESLLFTNVAQFHGFNPTFITVMEKALLINRLNREIEWIEQKKQSYIFTFLLEQQLIEHHFSAIIHIREVIEELKLEVDQLLAQLPYSFHLLKTKLRSLYQLSYNTTLAEEG